MNNKKLILCSIILLSFTILPYNATAIYRFYAENENYVVETVIYDAYYSDLDLDGFEDDIDILIKLMANFEGRFRATFLLTIELPSGNSFKFLLEAWLYISPEQPVCFKVTTLNTAIESGWYTVYLDGQIRGVPSGSFLTFCSFVFDPPTGQGSGNPTAYVSF